MPIEGASVERLTERLKELALKLGEPGCCYLAFSGGLDSTLLLNLLADAWRGRLLAVHVDHGLHASSSQWADCCEAEAGRLGVEFRRIAVDVDLDSGVGVEAAAREARYAAMAGLLMPGDWLLTAHHLDDQLETLLLNLLRGSGPDGLAAMPEYRRFAAGWLLRPLLGESRAALERAARSRNLNWIDDPGNFVQHFDRNYLRSEVVPVLRERWPDLDARLGVTVERAGEASELLRELAAIDLRELGEPQRMDLGGLRALSPARRRNVIRQALRELALPLPPGRMLGTLVETMVDAADDRAPHVAWAGAEARRYREWLHLMPPLEGEPSGDVAVHDGRAVLPAGLGELTVATAGDPADSLNVTWRKGGERLRLYPGGPTRKLKTLLQERGIVPWMRNRLPLVYRKGELVAAADCFVARAAGGEPVVDVTWTGHPPLH